MIDVYISNYDGPKRYSPNVRIYSGPFKNRHFIEPEAPWDQYDFYVGRRAYKAIKQWLSYLGGEYSVYVDGTTDGYTFRLDMNKLDIFLNLCHKEMELK